MPRSAQLRRLLLSSETMLGTKSLLYYPFLAGAGSGHAKLLLDSASKAVSGQTQSRCERFLYLQRVKFENLRISAEYPDMDDSEGVAGLLAGPVNVIMDVGMIFCPSMVYIPQYIKLMRTSSPQGFSPFVSLVLLTSNCLRIFFWAGKQFSVVLLWQAVLMVLTQILVLEMWTRRKRRLDLNYTPRPILTTVFPRFDRGYWIKGFWGWAQFRPFILLVLMYNVVWALLTLCLFWSSFYFEVIGFISLAIESQLALPQFIQNWKANSTQGLSTILVLLWVIGDSIKALYFVGNDSPIQFILSALISVTLDLLVLRQILVFPIPWVPTDLSPAASPRPRAEV